MIRHKLLRRTLVAVLASSTLCAIAFDAAAQAFPTKPIHLVVPSSPGGGTDAIGRLIADALSTSLKQQVVVENKAGASGVIGTEAIVRLPPDGYNIMIVQNGHTMNPAVMKKLPYDTVNDFTPIATLARTPLVLVSAAPTGVKTVKDMVELGKRDPARMSVAVSETSTRLAMEMISNATGVPMTSVYYKGTGPGVADVVGNHIGFTVTTMASTLPFKTSGKINYLGVLARQRSAFLPDVPTLAEQGLADVEMSGWWGIIGPASMPKPLVQLLHTAIQKAMADPEVKKRLSTLSAEPWISSPEDFDNFIRKDVTHTIELAKRAGMVPE